MRFSDYGSTVSNTNFKIEFTTNPPVAFTFDFLAWYNTILMERARAYWSGSTWTFAVITEQGPGNYNRAAVPEPASMLLLGLSLLGLGIAVRKRS